jgi:hypothetical protein
VKSRLGLIFDLIAAALLVGVVVLWVRSYNTADVLMWQRWHNDAGTYRGAFRTLSSGRGVVGIDFTELTTAFPSSASTEPKFEWTRTDAREFLLPRETFWNRLGIGYVSSSQLTPGLRSSTVTTRAYWAPYWLAALVASIVPLRTLAMLGVRAGRRRQRRCARCGYDVRFSEGRCPECGDPLPALSKRPPPPEASAR